MSEPRDAAWKIVREYLEGHGGEELPAEESHSPGCGVAPPGERPVAPFRGALKPGWPLLIEGFDDEATAALLETLVALPIQQRRAAALADTVEPTALLIFSLLDTATALRDAEPEEASSLADTALLLIGRELVAGQDCRFYHDRLIDYWLPTVERYLLMDQLPEAAWRLSFLNQLAQMSGDEPERAARLGINHAQLHWQRNELEATLTELEATLVYCELATDKSYLAAALLYQGLVLKAMGSYGPARQALERCLEVAPYNVEHVTAAARRILSTLEWLR